MVDEDTNDHLQAILLAGGADIHKTRADRSVDTDGGVSSLGNGLDVDLDVSGSLALTTVSEWRISDGPFLARVSKFSRLGSRWRWGWRWLRCWVGGSWQCRCRRGVWAEDHVVGLGDGFDDLGVSVGAWSIRGDGWVDPDSFTLGNSGHGSNSVSTSAGADVRGG